MYIPIIYLLFTAEIIFILTIFSIGLLVYIYKLLQKQNTETPLPEVIEEPDESFDLSTSYREYIEIEMARNQEKLKQEARIEEEILSELENETDEESDTVEENEDDTKQDDSDIDIEALEEELTNDAEDSNKTSSNAPDEAQSQLLKIRDMFLAAEKSSAEYQEHEIHFWNEVYKGMQKISDELKTTIIEEHKKTEMDLALSGKPEIKEKVFYIETQGKKVDGEVNKLKDIIYEQENALNAMRKSVGEAEAGDTDQAIIDEINAQIAALEAQLSDSKMCMDVMEMENERLQNEVNQLEAQYMQELQNSSTTEVEVDSTIDLSELQDLVDQQEKQINELNATIDTLKIDADMAETMKKTITEFAHSSQEMMGCISILEDENKHFKQEIENLRAAGGTPVENIEATQNNEDIEALKSQVQTLEEDLIKKDVAYAQLQEEFDSIEKEYLSMYEAMHGDNG